MKSIWYSVGQRLLKWLGLAETEAHMKSIWYFVGLLLTVMGAIITASALYSLANPPAAEKVLSHLHPDLWWGLFMLAFGMVFALLNRRKTVE